MDTTPTTTENFVKRLRDAGYRVTRVRPGRVAANNGRYLYRYEQTSQGWRAYSLGPVLCR